MNPSQIIASALLPLLLAGCGEVIVPDEEPPDTLITAGPGEAAREQVARLEFISNEEDVTFRCDVDGASPVQCTSPYTTATLAEGEHVFAVAAIDRDGNVDPTPAVYSWIIDVVAPAINIVDGPITGQPVADPTPTFSFTTEGAADVVCWVDDGARTACIDTYTTAALADGDHRFDVRATDEVGNVAVATRTFTVLR